MSSLHEDLERAAFYHGHLCSGQVLGVRMARYACRLLNIENPTTSKRLIVYVESDRCIADAIGTVTGCKLGKRTLKWMDFGKTAATFIDLKDNRAIRVRSICHKYPEEGENLELFFSQFSDEELFAVEDVIIDLKPGDMPGRPSEIQVCECCKEEVLDGKHVIRDGKILCRHCAGECYYRK